MRDHRLKRACAKQQDGAAVCRMELFSFHCLDQLQKRGYFLVRQAGQVNFLPPFQTEQIICANAENS